MAAVKSFIYLGGFTMIGYVLMKLVERDPDTFRKELPDRQQAGYHTESKKRTAAFMQVLQYSATGDNPEEAARKVRNFAGKDKTSPSPPPPPAAVDTSASS